MTKKLILLVASLLLASTGWAHTGLASSLPADGAQLQQSPENLELEFTAAVMLASVSLIDGSGQRVELQFKPRSQPDATHRVALPTLAAGSYRVNWKALGGDGHTVDGSFAFSLAPGAP